MNQRGQLAVAVVVLLTLLFAPALELLLTRPVPSAAAQDGAKPSILVIQTDDMRSDDLHAMPKTAAWLRRQGMTFENYIAGGTPLCCPNRSTALTGRYPHNHGVLTNGGKTGGHRTFKRRGNENRTIAVALDNHGYVTAYLGKYMNHYPSGKRGQIPRGWDQWHVLIMDKECDECRGGQETGYYYDYRLNQNGKVRRYGSNKGDYSTNVFTRTALKIINGVSDDTPLFIWVNPVAPHGPWAPGPGDKRKKVNTRFKTPAFNNAGAGKAQWIKKLPKMKSGLRKYVRNANRERRRTLLAVDDMVARLVPAMPANSWVFFLSDNGYMLGEFKIPVGKVVPYKPSVEVPLIVKGPGVAPGVVTTSLASSIDLVPTWAEIAGIPVEDLGFPVDGLSLLPVLTGEQPALARDSVLLEWGGSRLGSAIDDLDGDVLPPELLAMQLAPATTAPGPDTVTASKPNKKKKPKKRKGKGKGKGEGKNKKKGDRNPDYPDKELYRPKPFYALRGADWLYVQWRGGHKEYYDHHVQPFEMVNGYGSLSPERRAALAARVNALKNCSGANCTLGPMP